MGSGEGRLGVRQPGGAAGWAALPGAGMQGSEFGAAWGGPIAAGGLGCGVVPGGIGSMLGAGVLAQAHRRSEWIQEAYLNAHTDEAGPGAAGR